MSALLILLLTLAPGDAERGRVAFWTSSLGSELYGSMPWLVFEAMRELYPNELPGDLALIGLFDKPPEFADGAPAGLVRTRRYGANWMSTNCAICHVGRVGPDGAVTAGLPNQNFDVQATALLFNRIISNPALSASDVLAAAARRGYDASLWEGLVVRAWWWAAKRKVAANPLPLARDAGPGRSNAVNGWKRVLHVPQGDALSLVDIPVIYNQRGKSLTLYDGSISGDPAARVMLTELQKGRPAESLLADRQVFDDIIAFMEQQLAAPKYPGAIDQALAARGKAIFEESCEGCHGSYGKDKDYPNKRVALNKVGTDPNRARAMDQGLKDALLASPFKDYLSITLDPKYMPPPLEGVWASAPYLHNGSVPTLWHLFRPEEERPRSFVRRDNQYDLARVGLRCDEVRTEAGVLCPPDAHQRTLDERLLFVYDTRAPGNSNAGHPFTVELDEADKPAVLEYLKTL